MLEIQEGTGWDGEDCENGEGQEVLIKLDENGNDGNGVDNDGHGAGDNDWCSPSSSHT